jgi:hypothetical protein
MTRIISLVITMLFPAAALFAAQVAEVSPTAPYARYVVLENLLLFWIAILGLIIIIRMKLKEIERIGTMNPPKDEKGTPFLD